MDKYNSFIGIPYKRYGRHAPYLDCWGFVVYVYDKVYGIHLENYEGQDTKNGYTRASKYVLENMKNGDWVEVEGEWQEGDIALVNTHGNPLHIAIIIDDNHLIHSTEATDSIIENYRGHLWKNKIYKVIRHKHFA